MVIIDVVHQVKLIANWWAWELVPKRLAGRPTVKNAAKEVTGQPWKREPPLPAAANWPRHTDRELSEKILTQVKYLPAHPRMTAGREESEQESAKIRQHKAIRWSAMIS